MKVLVLFYSTYGHVYRLAQAMCSLRPLKATTYGANCSNPTGG